MDPREEEELRRLIRKELENRERLRDKHGEAERRQWTEDFSDERQRVIEEEIAAFYRSKGGYQRYENEDGEIEWLTDAEIREREQQIPVDIEELEVGQRQVRNRLIASVFLVVIVIALLMIVLRDKTGSVQVICNVPDAQISLNGSTTEYVTDAKLRNLPAGPHLISVSKYGYVPDGTASKRVDVRANHSEVVIFKLKPMQRDTLGGQG
ncbi:MAG: carboxypeptidase-like regulatory domain-containing protein [Calditrichota bacterium]